MKALIVDPERGILTILREILKSGAIRVVIAQGVAEASGALTCEGYDLAVVELNLSGTNGLVFIREMRQRGRDVPVIVTTSNMQVALMFADEFRSLGVTEILSKPFTIPMLFFAISRVLAISGKHMLLQARLASMAQEIQQNLLAG